MVTFRKKRKKARATGRVRANKGMPKRRARRAAAAGRAPARKTARRRSRKSRIKGTVHRPRLTLSGGKWYGSTRKGALIRRGRKTRINPRGRRVSKRVRRNSLRGATRTMFDQRILLNTAKAGAGIAIGFSAMPIFYKILPQGLKDQRQFLGGIHVAMGLAIAGFVKNRDVKDIGMVIAATGMYDLIAMNFTFLGLPPLRTTSELAEKLMPSASAPAITAPVQGCYGASYPTLGAPVSAVAATGVGASFERMGASYPSLAYPTVGLSGDSGEDMGWEEMIN